MSESFWVTPEGFEQAGRTNFRTSESAEQVQRLVNSVQGNAGSYGGADVFVGALNSTRDGHARGAGRASENRGTMGDADNAVAGHSRDLDAASNAQMTQAGVDMGIADQI